MDNFRDSYFNVTWDLTKKHLRGTFWGKQYDTGRGFAVTIVEGGQVTVPSNETVRLKWEKPDGTEGYVTAVVVDDKFLIENIDQMFTVHGAVRSDLEIWRGGKVISSITFYVSVEKAVAVDAIESSSEFTALQNAIATVDNVAQEIIDAKAQLADIVTLVNPNMSITEIQNKLNNGGTFKFISGEYHLDFQDLYGEKVLLDVKDNTFIDLSEATIILPATYVDSYKGILIRDRKNVTVKNGTIIGDRSSHMGSTGEWGHGLAVIGSKDVIIDGVNVKECWGDGFNLSKLSVGDVHTMSERVTIKNCVSSDNRRMGLTLAGALDSFIVNNTFENSNGTLPEAGIDIEPDRYGIVRNVKIVDNIIRGNAKEGILVSIRADLVGDTFVDSNIIRGNTIKANGTGIKVLTACSYNVISENFVEGNAGTGITISGPYNIVNDNIVLNNGGRGINLYVCLNARIIGNTVKGCVGEAISIQELSKFNIISNNTVEDNTYHGIALSKSSDNVVQGNDIYNNGTLESESCGIQMVSSSRRNNISGNTIRSGVNQKFGVRVYDSTSSMNFVSNNFLVGAGTVYDLVTLGASITTGPGNRFNAGFSVDYITL